MNVIVLPAKHDARVVAVVVKSALIRVAVEELSRDLNSEIKRRVDEIGQNSGVGEVLTS